MLRTGSLNYNGDTAALPRGKRPRIYSVKEDRAGDKDSGVLSVERKGRSTVKKSNISRSQIVDGVSSSRRSPTYSGSSSPVHSSDSPTSANTSGQSSPERRITRTTPSPSVIQAQCNRPEPMRTNSLVLDGDSMQATDQSLQSSAPSIALQTRGGGGVGSVSVVGGGSVSVGGTGGGNLTGEVTVRKDSVKIGTVAPLAEDEATLKSKLRSLESVLEEIPSLNRYFQKQLRKTERLFVRDRSGVLRVKHVDDFVQKMAMAFKAEGLLACSSSDPALYEYKMVTEARNACLERSYDLLFYSDEEKEADQKLDEMIGMLQWLRPKHLDVSDKYWDPHLWDAAQRELRGLSGFTAPRAKLECMLNACRVIFFLLKSSDDRAAGADEFFPLLVYIIVMARVRHIHAELQYVTIYGTEVELAGEISYYLTQVQGALSFIENIHCEMLNNVNQEEFDGLMQAFKLMGGMSRSSDYHREKERDREKLHGRHNSSGSGISLLKHIRTPSPKVSRMKAKPSPRPKRTQSPPQHREELPHVVSPLRSKPSPLHKQRSTPSVMKIVKPKPKADGDSNSSPSLFRMKQLSPRKTRLRSNDNHESEKDTTTFMMAEEVVAAAGGMEDGRVTILGPDTNLGIQTKVGSASSRESGNGEEEGAGSLLQVLDYIRRVGSPVTTESDIEERKSDEPRNCAKRQRQKSFKKQMSVPKKISHDMWGSSEKGSRQRGAAKRALSPAPMRSSRPPASSGKGCTKSEKRVRPKASDASVPKKWAKKNSKGNAAKKDTGQGYKNASPSCCPISPSNRTLSPPPDPNLLPPGMDVRPIPSTPSSSEDFFSSREQGPDGKELLQEPTEVEETTSNDSRERSRLVATALDVASVETASLNRKPASRQTGALRVSSPRVPSVPAELCEVDVLEAEVALAPSSLADSTTMDPFALSRRKAQGFLQYVDLNSRPEPRSPSAAAAPAVHSTAIYKSSEIFVIQPSDSDEGETAGEGKGHQDLLLRTAVRRSSTCGSEIGSGAGKLRGKGKKRRVGMVGEGGGEESLPSPSGGKKAAREEEKVSDIV